MNRILLALLIPAVFIGCEALTGKEIARLEINQISSEANMIVKEVTLDLLQGDEIGIWSDMDMKYEGDVGMAFRIQVLKDGQEYTVLEVDPREKNISMGEVKTDVMGKIDWSFMGKNGTVTIEESGPYTFKALFMASNNPTLQVKKAELVLKK